ncbi:hypothetical protein ABGV42_00665 [Paenibacillus pabuli]|uniref:hypothetical protein n=1 Tax=Paenibacillus pabuli TaxID=1472 RepID=UPI003242D2AA
MLYAGVFEFLKTASNPNTMTNFVRSLDGKSASVFFDLVAMSDSVNAERWIDIYNQEAIKGSLNASIQNPLN